MHDCDANSNAELQVHFVIYLCFILFRRVYHCFLLPLRQTLNLSGALLHCVVSFCSSRCLALKTLSEMGGNRGSRARRQDKEDKQGKRHRLARA